MSGTVTLEILRYVPEEHDAPVLHRYPVPRDTSWSVLDALHHVRDELDPGLAYRWSCRMGVCGSCGMMIDGVPRLACEVFLRDLQGAGGVVRIEPLDHFPIERDLIVDQEGFLAKLASVRPWLVPRPGAATGPVGELLQTPAERGIYERYSMCINCLLCYSACPQFGLNERFLGPAVIALAHRYDQDSRDAGADDRREALQAHDGVWSCTLVGYCSEVCPHGVDPAAAIQQEKVAGALDWAKSLLCPRGGS